MADARRHRLRHGAGRDAARTRRAACRARSPTRRPPARCCRPARSDAVGDVHARPMRRTTPPRPSTVAINVLKATPTITWPTPADIAYGTALGATQLNATAERAGHVRLHAGRRHGAERGRGADAVGDLHADRRGELHDRDGDGRDQRAEGDAGDHLADAGRHHLRHGAGRDAAERDGERAGHVRLHARSPARC